MALTAVIFDLDGTLVDTNKGHVSAWNQAFKRLGYTVSRDRIEVEIGKGGDKLVPSILGREIDHRDGDALREAQVEEFLQIAAQESLQVFPGAQRLLDALHDRGMKTALATSSKRNVVEAIFESARVEWLTLFDVIVTAEDASESKPAPDIVNTAIGKLKLSPTECAMVGDTPYDIDTARDAGVICIGVTCGQLNDAALLRSTGARAVYSDPQDIAAQLEQMLTAASPGLLVLTESIVTNLMREALQVARAGLEKGEVPIGCIIATGDGTIVARGFNEQNATNSKVAHAEMVAFGRLTGKTNIDARDLILVSTLEPCVMCLGACMEAAVDTVIYSLAAPADGGRLRVRPPTSPLNQMPRLVGGILGNENKKLLREFEKRAKDPVQIDFVRELLQES